jgi:hypothetical protein
LYSLCGVITSRAVGLYPLGVLVAVGAAVGVGRLPRAKPDPRVDPNVPGGWGWLVAGAALADSAGAGALAGRPAAAGFGAPDFSLSDMCVVVYEAALTLKREHRG